MINWLSALRARFQQRGSKPAPPEPATPIERYLANGRLPWTPGYWEYRLRFTAEALANAELSQTFRACQPLPAGYGARLDERVVEYPWVLSRLADQPGLTLDAGGTLSYGYLLNLPTLQHRRLLVYSLTHDSEMVTRPTVSYLRGDLRCLPLTAAAVDAIVCISTLEHVGLDNTQVYGANEFYREQRPQTYRGVLHEFQRLLTPGGKLYLTVPFGQYANHGWLQQFDEPMVNTLISDFSGRLETLTFFRYQPEGWQVASAGECRDARYFDVHQQPDHAPDFAAAARAVACLALVKG